MRAHPGLGTSLPDRRISVPVIRSRAFLARVPRRQDRVCMLAAADQGPPRSTAQNDAPQRAQEVYEAPAEGIAQSTVGEPYQQRQYQQVGPACLVPCPSHIELAPMLCCRGCNAP